jgi:predicted site-specific integrase-resolvase
MINELHSESLGRWARRCGVSYRTAWRWFRTDKLPKEVIAEQMPTGTILVRDGRYLSKNAPKTEEAVIYARINPRQNESLMQDQIESCRAFCGARGWTVARIVREAAPGVGPQRVKLERLIQERVPRLVIATTSVLSRFDFRFYEALWQSMECELIVVDRSDEIAGKGGALEDLTDAINITCHRHYGPKRGTALLDLLSRVIHGTIPV